MRNRVISLLIVSLLLVSCNVGVTDCVNPVIYSDVADAQTIKVGSIYYLFSSSDYSSRGIPFIQSKDLVHWNPAGNIHDPDYANTPMKCVSTIEKDGMIHVMFYSKVAEQNVLYSTKNIADGNWEVSVLDSSFQSGSLFIDNRKLFFVFVEGDTIQIEELDSNFNPDKASSTAIITSYMSDKEISHPRLYHIGEWYYLLLTEEDDNHYSRQLCGRSEDLFGDYQFKLVLDGSVEPWKKGTARSSLMETSNCEWYAMCSTKIGSYGFGASLQPVTWIDGWPIMGDNSASVESFKVRLKPHPDGGQLFAGDDFSTGELSDSWQIMDRGDTDSWSLTAHPGSLTLYSNRKSIGLNDSESYFIHRVSGGKVNVYSDLYIKDMKPGQYAGVALFQGDNYATMGVHVRKNGKKHFLYQEHVDGKLNIICSDKLLVTSDFISLGLGIYPDSGMVRGLMKYHQYDSSWICFYDTHHPNFNNYENLIGLRVALFNYTTEEVGGSVSIEKIEIANVDEAW